MRRQTKVATMDDKWRRRRWVAKTWDAQLSEWNRVRLRYLRRIKSRSVYGESYGKVSLIHKGRKP